jgi:hypothetical protein
MKRNLIYATLALSSMLGMSCEYDNYDGPSSKLQGRIVYNGTPIGVSYNDVSFELWEPGWVKRNRIPVAVDQDGNYSALLFDANYKLIIPSHQGPFMSIENDQTGSDTILVELNGNKSLDIEVLPYYMIRNPQFSASNNKVTSSIQLEKIITGVDEKNIERVSLYISKTYFVDGRTSIAATNINGGDITDMNNLSLEVAVPEIKPVQSYVYARVGVKISGVEDMIFSPIQKVDL